jgi:polysaccharide export outer membrane protein
MNRRSAFLAGAMLAISLAGRAQTPPAPAETDGQVRSTYVLGPDDQVTVRALDVEEISEKPVRIDMSGHIRLPMAGRIQAAGLTVEQLENAIALRLKEFVKDPEVTVSIAEFRSQPVSVIGSVKNPGVHQLEGHKTLIEIVSLAGGLADDAGYSVKITRRLEWGAVPLPNAQNDASGKYSVGEVRLKEILDASKPDENIVIKPFDVVSVPRAEMVYVTGEVQRAGGYVLRERETLSVLQALSLAGGMSGSASPKNARILRPAGAGASRVEIAVDLQQIIRGKAKDVPLRAEDILFIPENAPKKAMVRAAEAALTIGTGLAIYRR